MENVPLKLDTDYEAYGNSSGMQIDTLSIAVCGSDWNEIEGDNYQYIEEGARYAVNEYNFEADFLATLTKEQAQAFIWDVDGYKYALSTFTEELKDNTLFDVEELDSSHPLAIAIQEARDEQEEQLRQEWLYGDYREEGILGEASKRYGVRFHYDEKSDTLTFDIDEGELADLVEFYEVEKTPESVGEHIAMLVQHDAFRQREKAKARKEERRKDWNRRREIQKAEEERKESERIEKLKAIA